MSRIARDAGFVVLLLAVAASLSWFFSKVRQAGVENYLALLGDSLFAMMPESRDKEQLKQKYDQFLADVAARKVPPEEVELVAANILNLSNTNQGLTAAQAETLLFLAKLPQETGQRTPIVLAPVLPASPGAAMMAGDSAVPPPPPATGLAESTPEKWEAMHQRIKMMYEFNHRFKGELAGLAPHPEAMQRFMHFRMAPDMKITVVINDSLKKALLHRKQLAIARELERLEKEKRLVWQQNFRAQLQLDRERLQQDIRRLQELQQKGGPESRREPSDWHGLENLSRKTGPDSAAFQAELRKALEEAKRALREVDSLHARMEKN
ncbi:MAG: hypothetical protein ONB48_05410 [candidate division KSB1 bacterium]|nr:hypothetical protein [candidate division KSB1 bacterium]MDZ7272983.1 hypothetical protein [candidate division KSB1 bacterium]MDZ7285087.1 hypothetical protein [candidate division KSB1 bacterium]MDZ7298119.1 hypothetical protein [candidate division KSB1 bacterium]MDZ7309333.1 hypothetical protein [candidate division KSB1 bacterium]